MIETTAFWFLVLFNMLVLSYFLMLNTVYLLMSLVAFRELRRYALRLKTLDLDNAAIATGTPPITVIAPAFNEAATCVGSIKSLLTLTYSHFEIVVVNDGSTDDTLDRLQEAYKLVRVARLATASLATAPIRDVYQSRLHPNLWVVDKENGGKADALNAGLNFAISPFFCAMDADSVLERDALTRIVRPFLEDDRTVAAGGVIRIVNGCRVEQGVVTDVRLPRNLLAKFQVLEYLRGFLVGRMGFSALGMTLIISGAFGLFRRGTVVAAGGYASRRTSGETVGEDMELVVRLQRYCREQKLPSRVTFIPDPVAWTECPENLRLLGRQRDRWQRGLVESLTRHRVMLGNPRYGRIGTVAFPYYFFLEMIGPGLEFLGYVGFGLTLLLGLGSPMYIGAFLAVAVLYGMAISVGSVVLEELTFRRYTRFRDLLTLFGVALIENFGYRQLSTFFRFRGLVSAMRRVRSWGSMDRQGFERLAVEPSTPQKTQDPDRPNDTLR